jgi:hypothetical protein
MLESVDDYRESIRARRMRLWGLMLVTLGVAMGVIIAMRFFTPQVLLYSPLVSLAALFLMAIPVIVWNNPRAGLYILAMTA